MNRQSLLLLLFILSGAFSALQAQTTKRTMTIVDFLNIPSVSDPQLAPDGNYFLYVLSESDWKANRQVSHIWRCAVGGSGAVQMTFGESGENSPRWSPDGKWIAFLATRGEKAKRQIFLMRTDGGEARRLTSHATNVGNFSWSPDGQTIYFLASDEESADEKKRQEKKDDVFAYDENYQQQHLWKFDVQTEKENRLTEGDFSVLSFDLGRKGDRILIQRSINPLFGDYFQSEIWIMDIDGANARQLTQNSVGESNARLSPDGSQVLFLADANESFEPYYNDNLFLMQADGSKEPVLQLKDISYEFSSAEWSADGRSIFLLANMGLETQLWQFDPATSRLTQLTKGNHSLSQWNYSPERNQHLIGLNQADSPGDIHLIRGQELVQLTHHFDYLADTFLLPRQEKVTWKGEDGVTVEGLLHYPIGYEAGKRYPLAVQTHGGPASADHFGFSRGFTHYHPVMAAQGYLVLQPNYRGSTGYGDAFLRDMVGSYFRQAHLDVMAGVDELIRRGLADPDRLVKMGWSAGGHMTNKLITFTNRFKAASSGAGAMNWISMYAQSDVRTYRTPWFGGTPWQQDAPIDNYWNNSPLKDVHKAKTPTLVLVGERDPRVPLPQSVELYRALKSLNVATRLYIAPREPHGWQELRHRLHKINAELDWFAQYALEKEYEWEKAPEE